MLDIIYTEGLRLRRVIAQREDAQTLPWLIDRDIARASSGKAEDHSGWVAGLALAAGAIAAALWLGNGVVRSPGTIATQARPVVASTSNAASPGGSERQLGFPPSLK
jgi:hypothetical protein